MILLKRIEPKICIRPNLNLKSSPLFENINKIKKLSKGKSGISIFIMITTCSASRWTFNNPFTIIKIQNVDANANANAEGGV